jgi:hypothetical protein
MNFRSLPLILLVLACARNDVSDFWRAGGEYHLKLVLTDRPSLTPEQERYFNPQVDSVTLLLSVDSIVAAKVYGRVAGDTRHFPVAFHAVGGDHFSATRAREHSTITINPAATDTGLSLDGELSHGAVAGGWTTRSSLQTNGRFRLAPTTYRTFQLGAAQSSAE